MWPALLFSYAQLLTQQQNIINLIKHHCMPWARSMHRSAVCISCHVCWCWICTLPLCCGVSAKGCAVAMATRSTSDYYWALALLLVLFVRWHVAANMHTQLLCQTVEICRTSV
jgi:hypothetical protein